MYLQSSLFSLDRDDLRNMTMNWRGSVKVHRSSSCCCGWAASWVDIVDKNNNERYSQQDDVFWEDAMFSSPAHEFGNKIVIIVIFTWVHLCSISNLCVDIISCECGLPLSAVNLN